VTDRRTDRQTDRILLAIPRLHYMQRDKNEKVHKKMNMNEYKFSHSDITELHRTID